MSIMFGGQSVSGVLEVLSPGGSLGGTVSPGGNLHPNLDTLTPPSARTVNAVALANLRRKFQLSPPTQRLQPSPPACRPANTSQAPSWLPPGASLSRKAAAHRAHRAASAPFKRPDTNPVVRTATSPSRRSATSPTPGPGASMPMGQYHTHVVNLSNARSTTPPPAGHSHPFQREQHRGAGTVTPHWKLHAPMFAADSRPALAVITNKGGHREGLAPRAAAGSHSPTLGPLEQLVQAALSVTEPHPYAAEPDPGAAFLHHPAGVASSSTWSDLQQQAYRAQPAASSAPRLAPWLLDDAYDPQVASPPRSAGQRASAAAARAPPRGEAALPSPVGALLAALEPSAFRSPSCERRLQRQSRPGEDPAGGTWPASQQPGPAHRQRPFAVPTAQLWAGAGEGTGSLRQDGAHRGAAAGPTGGRLRFEPVRSPPKQPVTGGERVRSTGAAACAVAGSASVLEAPTVERPVGHLRPSGPASASYGAGAAPSGAGLPAAGRLSPTQQHTNGFSAPGVSGTPWGAYASGEAPYRLPLDPAFDMDVAYSAHGLKDGSGPWFLSPVSVVVTTAAASTVANPLLPEPLIPTDWFEGVADPSPQEYNQWWTAGNVDSRAHPASTHQSQAEAPTPVLQWQEPHLERSRQASAPHAGMWMPPHGAVSHRREAWNAPAPSPAAAESGRPNHVATSASATAASWHAREQQPQHGAVRGLHQDGTWSMASAATSRPAQEERGTEPQAARYSAFDAAAASVAGRLLQDAQQVGMSLLSGAEPAPGASPPTLSVGTPGHAGFLAEHDLAFGATGIAGGTSQVGPTPELWSGGPAAGAARQGREQSVGAKPLGAQPSGGAAGEGQEESDVSPTTEAVNSFLGFLDFQGGWGAAHGPARSSPTAGDFAPPPFNLDADPDHEPAWRMPHSGPGPWPGCAPPGLAAQQADLVRFAATARAPSPSLPLTAARERPQEALALLQRVFKGWKHRVALRRLFAFLARSRGQKLLVHVFGAWQDLTLACQTARAAVMKAVVQRRQLRLLRRALRAWVLAWAQRASVRVLAAHRATRTLRSVLTVWAQLAMAAARSRSSAPQAEAVTPAASPAPGSGRRPGNAVAPGVRAQQGSAQVPVPGAALPLRATAAPAAGVSTGAEGGQPQSRGTAAQGAAVADALRGTSPACGGTLHGVGGASAVASGRTGRGAMARGPEDEVEEEWVAAYGVGMHRRLRLRHCLINWLRVTDRAVRAMLLQQEVRHRVLSELLQDATMREAADLLMRHRYLAPVWHAWRALAASTRGTVDRAVWPGLEQPQLGAQRSDSLLACGTPQQSAGAAPPTPPPPGLVAALPRSSASRPGASILDNIDPAFIDSRVAAKASVIAATAGAVAASWDGGRLPSKPGARPHESHEAQGESHRPVGRRSLDAQPRDVSAGEGTCALVQDPARDSRAVESHAPFSAAHRCSGSLHTPSPPASHAATPSAAGVAQSGADAGAASACVTPVLGSLASGRTRTGNSSASSTPPSVQLEQRAHERSGGGAAPSSGGGAASSGKGALEALAPTELFQVLESDLEWYQEQFLSSSAAACDPVGLAPCDTVQASPHTAASPFSFAPPAPCPSVPLSRGNSTSGVAPSESSQLASTWEGAAAAACTGPGGTPFWETSSDAPCPMWPHEVLPDAKQHCEGPSGDGAGSLWERVAPATEWSGSGPSDLAAHAGDAQGQDLWRQADLHHNGASGPWDASAGQEAEFHAPEGDGTCNEFGDGYQRYLSDFPSDSEHPFGRQESRGQATGADYQAGGFEGGSPSTADPWQDQVSQHAYTRSEQEFGGGWEGSAEGWEGADTAAGQGGGFADPFDDDDSGWLELRDEFSASPVNSQDGTPYKRYVALPGPAGLLRLRGNQWHAAAS